MIIILMGPSGSGKTTVGKALAASLGWPFIEGDDFHPDANVERMRSGVALTDADRAPWLEALAAVVVKLADDETSGVIACSALKRAYRSLLVPTAKAAEATRFVYLEADPQLLAERLATRRGHFFAAAMLDSQLDALEVPSVDERAAVLAVDAARSVGDVVADIRRALGI